MYQFLFITNFFPSTRRAQANQENEGFQKVTPFEINKRKKILWSDLCAGAASRLKINYVSHLTKFEKDSPMIG